MDKCLAAGRQHIYKSFVSSLKHSWNVKHWNTTVAIPNSWKDLGVFPKLFLHKFVPRDWSLEVPGFVTVLELKL